MDDGRETGGGAELTADDCIRAGMYWFGQGDLSAAEAWWKSALAHDPANARAEECLRLLARSLATRQAAQRTSPTARAAAESDLLRLLGREEPPGVEAVGVAAAPAADRSGLGTSPSSARAAARAPTPPPSAPASAPSPGRGAGDRASPAAAPRAEGASELRASIIDPFRAPDEQPELEPLDRAPGGLGPLATLPPWAAPASARAELDEVRSAYARVRAPGEPEPELAGVARFTGVVAPEPSSERLPQPALDFGVEADEALPENIWDQILAENASGPIPAALQAAPLPSEPWAPKDLSSRGLGGPSSSVAIDGHAAPMPALPLPTPMPWSGSTPSPPPWSGEPSTPSAPLDPVVERLAARAPPSPVADAVADFFGGADAWGVPELGAPALDEPGFAPGAAEPGADHGGLGARLQASLDGALDPHPLSSDAVVTGDLDDGAYLVPPSEVRTPWDAGPSRTAVVTLAPESDLDAVAEQTPLPELEREQFFGRNTGDFPRLGLPSPPSIAVRGTLDATPLDVLPMIKPPVSRSAELRAATPVALEAAPLRAAPAPLREGSHTPDILIDEPIELPEDKPKGARDWSQVGPELRLREAKDRYSLHDFEGAIELLGTIAPGEPGYDEARGLLTEARGQLTRMYESKIGDFDAVPRLRVTSEEVIWLNLNHRAGFILSQIDGSVSFDDIVSLSGMPRLDTLQILAELIQDSVIGTD